MPRVVIVGGGIAGLSAAYDLTRAGVECTLFEKQPRTGRRDRDAHAGKAAPSMAVPTASSAPKPEALALIKELGLEGEVIGSNDHQRTTYISEARPAGRAARRRHDDRAVEGDADGEVAAAGLGDQDPHGVRAVCAGRRRAYRRIAAWRNSWWIILARRRWIIWPSRCFRGVYGGDPAQLERRERAAAISSRWKRSTAAWAARSMGAPRPAARRVAVPLAQVRDETMVEKVACGLNIRHERVERSSETADFRVRAGGEWIEADHVILACPAWSAAQMLAGRGAGARETAERDSVQLFADAVSDLRRREVRRPARGIRVPGSASASANAWRLHIRRHEISVSRAGATASCCGCFSAASATKRS